MFPLKFVADGQPSAGLVRASLLALALVMCATQSAYAQSAAEMAALEARLMARLEVRLSQETDSLRAEQVALRTSVSEAVQSLSRSDNTLNRRALQAIDNGQVNDGVEVLEERARVQDAIAERSPSARQSATRAADWKNIAALGFLENGDRAISSYERALHFAPNDAETLDRLAFLYERAGRASDALVMAQRLQALPDAESRAKGLLHEGRVVQLSGDLPRALQLFEQATLIADESDLHAQRAQLLATRAQIALTARDIDGGTALAEQALAVAREHHLRLEEAYAFQTLAFAQYIGLDSLGGALGLGGARVDRAIAYLDQAEPIFRELGEMSEVAATLDTRARLLYYRLAYAEAADSARESIRIAESVGNRPMAAWGYRTLGIVYSFSNFSGWRRDITQVDANFTRARELAHGAGVPHMEALILLEWATALSRMGQRGRACPLAQEGQRIWLANVHGATRDEEIMNARVQRFC